MRQGKSKKGGKSKVEVEELVSKFKAFLFIYDIFRRERGLPAHVKNIFEVTSSMSDKLGRICRYVKHQERNDPKEDWPDGMTTEISGLLVYMIMILDYYNVDISSGMTLELKKAVKQHSKKIRKKPR